MSTPLTLERIAEIAELARHGDMSALYHAGPEIEALCALAQNALEAEEKVRALGKKHHRYVVRDDVLAILSPPTPSEST